VANSPWKIWRSVPQIPQASTCTRTCPGPGRGRSSSAMRTSCGPWNTAALTLTSTRARTLLLGAESTWAIITGMEQEVPHADVRVQVRSLPAMLRSALPQPGCRRASYAARLSALRLSEHGAHPLSRCPCRLGAICGTPCRTTRSNHWRSRHHSQGADRCVAPETHSEIGARGPSTPRSAQSARPTL